MVTQKRGQTRKDASPACPSAETSTADVVVAKDAAAKNNYEIVNFRPKIVCTIEGDWVEKTVGLVPCIPLQFGDIKEARILKEQKLSHAIVKEDLGLYHVTTRYTNCWKGLFCSCEVQILVEIISSLKPKIQEEATRHQNLEEGKKYNHQTSSI